MKIVSIVGARPNFMKLAPVHKTLSSYCNHIIIHTGQHYDYEMSDIFFKELQIPKPDINLGVGSSTPGAQIGEMIKGLENEFSSNKRKGIATNPDLVLVYGDTNSTFAGTLAASVNNIPVAHVESGIRSFDRRMPEERNRILSDHISDILFAPTETAVSNLMKEHVTGKVVNSGDISVEMVDQASAYSRNSTILEELSLTPKSYILFTMHRAENTDSYANFKEIIEAFHELNAMDIDNPASVGSELNGRQMTKRAQDETQHIPRSNMKIVFPVHPRTEKILRYYGLYDELTHLGNLTITKPLGYIQILRLVQDSYKVVTDSGGLQKEAYLCSVPCITIRRSTEWVETLAGGWNILCDFKKSELVHLVSQQNTELRNSNSGLIFGRGNTSEIIRDVIIYRVGKRYK